MKTKAATSIVGLAFESGHLTVVWLRRAGGRVQVRRSVRSPFSLDPVTSDPELVGREIRNCLAKAGVRETRCVVCVPLKWVLTLRTPLPQLSGEDARNYVNVQAERAFPFAPEDLAMAVSRYQTSAGESWATITAIPMHQLTALLRALRAAKLRPVGMTLGITSLLHNEGREREGEVTMLLDKDGVDLAVLAGGGVVALRALDEAVDPDLKEDGLDAGALAQQIRITLGQLPGDLGQSIRRVRLLGPANLAESLAAGMREGVGRLGLSVEVGGGGLEALAGADGMEVALAPSAAAAERLNGRRSDFEYLPPRTSRFKQMTGRVSSRAALWLGGTAAALVLAIAGAFGYQHWRLTTLESRWQAMEGRVQEVAGVQERIRRFRSWFDDSPQSLVILRRLTEAFPEEGTVWASSLEIRESEEAEGPVVSCSGKARSNDEWLRMLERLRETAGVVDLRFEQVRGEAPLQFTLSFRWNGGQADGG